MVTLGSASSPSVLTIAGVWPLNPHCRNGSRDCSIFGTSVLTELVGRSMTYWASEALEVSVFCIHHLDGNNKAFPCNICCL